jgi:hypothetical protein
MDNSSLDPTLVEQLKKLQQKYAVMGQDLSVSGWLIICRLSYLLGLHSFGYTFKFTEP